MNAILRIIVKLFHFFVLDQNLRLNIISAPKFYFSTYLLDNEHDAAASLRLHTLATALVDALNVSKEDPQLVLRLSINMDIFSVVRAHPKLA